MGDAAWQLGMGTETSASLVYNEKSAALVIDSIRPDSEAGRLGVPASAVLLSVNGRRLQGLDKKKAVELMQSAARPMQIVTLPTDSFALLIDAKKLVDKVHSGL